MSATKNPHFYFDSWQNKQNCIDYLRNLDPKEGLVIEIKKVKNPMTSKQRGAMHLYCSQLAEALNAAGWDMRKTMREEFEIPWTTHSVKENLWKEILKAKTGLSSTEEQETPHINLVYETLNREIALRTGVSVPFPSWYNG